MELICCSYLGLWSTSREIVICPETLVSRLATGREVIYKNYELRCGHQFTLQENIILELQNV
jgi:hypothetical protein